jgi:hypothetical protein
VELNEFSFEIEGAFKIGSLSSSDFLELVVDPYAEGVEKAATAGDDWSGLERRFMDLQGQVEDWECIHTGIHAMSNVFTFTWGQYTLEFYIQAKRRLLRRTAKRSASIWGRYW